MPVSRKQQGKVVVIVLQLRGRAGNANQVPRSLAYTYVLPSRVLDVSAILSYYAGTEPAHLILGSPDVSATLHGEKINGKGLDCGIWALAF